MAYRLAIAISGAVSLGSYEAGVVFEVIEAIGQHNLNHPDEPEKHILIDVLTGASAGGMTAVVLAQKLLFEAKSLQGGHSNALYQSWVKDIDITHLLSSELNDNPAQSLLSSNYIAKVAEQVLLPRYQGDEVPSVDRHPASAEHIHLGLALTNLNGVDYSVDAFKNADLDSETGAFTQTRFQDSFTCLVDRAQDRAEFWQEIEVAARASGAFPLAFRPLKLERKYTEPDYFNKAKPFEQEAFTFVDGGTFNNYPLGMAKSLVNQIDKDSKDYESRFYLFISPNSKVSTKFDIDGDSANVLKTNAALLHSIFNQARFQDWIVTSRYNELVKELDQRAKSLSLHLMAAEPSEIESLAKGSDVILDKIFATEHQRNCTDELAILRERYADQDYGQALLKAKGASAIEAWLKAIQVLEAAGKLHNRDHMPIYTITAASEELASEALFGFAGFLDERFREFDYNVGRKKAREFLLQLKHLVESGECEESHLPLTGFHFEEDLPELENLGGAKIKDASQAARRDLQKRIHERSDLWLKQAGMIKIMRFFLLMFVDRKLKKLLDL